MNNDESDPEDSDDDNSIDFDSEPSVEPPENDDEYQFDFREREDYDYADSVTIIKGKVSLNNVKVGIICGHIIQRNNIFYELCDSISDEVQKCGVTFFNANGNLQGPMKHKVSDECNYDGYMHVSEVRIKSKHRGRELGLRLFHKLLDHFRFQWSICFILPAPLNSTGLHLCSFHA
jgi:hypothetical protein